MRRRALLLLSAVLVLLMLGCPAPRDVLLVAIPQGDQVMALGHSVYLTADVVTTGGAPTTVTWESDDVSVATVTSGGLVRAVGLGSTSVVATSVADTAMSAEVSITVRPVPVQRLTVSRSGEGSGSVTSDPVGIDCGDACSAEFDEGASVTLTAEPLQGSFFVGWSGACSGSSTICSLRMTEAQSVTATFDVVPTELHTLSVSRSGSGSGTVTSSPDGIDCGSMCTLDFAEDLTVTLTAVPAAGSEHAGWSGCDAMAGAQCTVSMSEARNVTATFDLQLYTLSVSRSGSGSGTVSSSPAGISCGADCSESYVLGTSVTLTASAASGSTFAGWSGACSGTSSTCTVSMTQARNVTATFNVPPPPDQETLSVSRLGSGSGTVASSPSGIDCGSTCTAVFDIGTSVTLSANAATGSVFAGWGGACSGTGACTVSLTEARNVTATFDLQLYTLSVSRSGSGSGTVSSSPAGISCGADCSESYVLGTSVTLTASPASGSSFGSWSGCQSASGNQCTVSMTQARSVTATFTADPVFYTLSVSRSGSGSGTVSSSPAGISCGSDCSESYVSGTSVTLTASPASGSSFGSWSGCQTASGNQCTVSMTQARSVTAAFTADPSGPGNDDFASAALISGGSGSTTGSNVGATQEVGEPSHCGYAGGASVWWRWTAPESGQVTITTVGSSFDVLLGVYTGTSVGGLQAVACDGATIGPNNSVTFAATAGTTYRIAVDGFGGVTGSIVLNWSLTAGPTPGPWTLAVSRAGTGSCTVTSNPSGINCGSDCSESFADGTSVTLTATVASGSTFGGWSGCQSASGNQCTVSMTQARSVTATCNLAPQTQSITISVSGLPTGVAANAVLIEPSGSTRTITATTTIVGAAGTYRLLAGTVVSSSATAAYAPSSLDQSVSVPAGGTGNIALAYSSVGSRVVAPATSSCGASTAVGQTCVVAVALSNNTSGWNGVQIGMTNSSFAYQTHTLGSALSGRGCYATGSDNGVGAVCASSFSSGTLFEIEYRRVAAGASRFAASNAVLSTLGGAEATPAVGSLVVR